MALTPYEQTAFWTRQFGEHLQFLSLLFTDVGLKSEAANLAKHYERARSNALAQDNRAMALIAPMNRTVREFQQEALDRLERGEFLGWAYPLFVEHITREMDLYAHLVGDEPAPLGSVSTAVKQLGAEHALFAAHLLDPGQTDLIAQATDAANDMFALGVDPATDHQAIVIEEAIGQFMTDNKLGRVGGAPSIIPRALADHVVREQDYFAQTLRDNSARGRVL